MRSLRGQEGQRYVLGGGGCTTAEEQLSLPGCLSASSASLLPYTLSHFSPMSLPDQGGGDVRKEKKKMIKEDVREGLMKQRQFSDLKERKIQRDDDGDDQDTCCRKL